MIITKINCAILLHSVTTQELSTKVFSKNKPLISSLDKNFRYMMVFYRIYMYIYIIVSDPLIGLIDFGTVDFLKNVLLNNIKKF